MLCIVGAGTCDNHTVAAGIGFGFAEKLQLFSVGKGRRFACGAADDDGPDTGIDLAADQTLEKGIVDVTV